MPEDISHNDILTRVIAVEHQQDAMQAQLIRVEEKADTAAQAALDNKSHFDLKLGETHLQLVEHRAEFKGMRTGLGWGLTILGGVTTVGLAIIGWLLAQG